MTEQNINHAEESPWLAGPRLAELPDGAMHLLQYEADGIVLVNWHGAVTAFRNRCLHQELPIHAGYLTPEGILLCPWHNWCYQVETGECLTVPGALLERFPVRIQDERVFVQAPMPAPQS
ncbi:MAG: Rieske 2Fe-2S domain-containing protein [Caldilineaceae bacterium]